MLPSLFRYLFPFCLLICGTASELYAQDASYPVTAVVRTLPPFGPNLSDWADPFNDRLGVTLLLNDRQAPGFQVRLRITIEGQGITLRTRPDFQARPIALSYGIPVQLSSSQLIEYFDLSSFDFIGFDQASYLTQGGLPSGLYSLCIEAIDYDRFDEEAASTKACSFLQAALLDPPAVLSPVGAQIALPLQNLAVQWQARHTASFLTDYTVEIYEIDPLDQFTPEQIYALQQPFVFTTVSGITSVNIDQNFPALEPGSRYLLRVRAEDPMGSNAFKNGGYSEPIFFSYGSACTPPPDFSLTATPNGYDRARIEFIATPGANRHVVRYREQNPDANWYEEEVEFFNFVELEYLSPSTTYEVQVQGVCGGGAGAFSPIFAFETEDRPFDPTAVDCGDEIKELPKPTNQTPLPDLNYGEVVKVGQFDMKIVSATSAGGDGWKGAGQIYIGWLGANINCSFNRLYINTDRQVYDGVVLALDDGLSSIPGFKSVKDVVAERDTSKLTFCGDSIPSSGGPSKEPPHDLLYGTSTGSYSTTYTPYDPNRPGVQEWSALFYSKWNPKNPTNPYLASDYSNPANPYTSEKPYVATNIWNPWNGYNSYDPKDYDDPANPWTAEKPWTADGMFKKQGQMAATTNSYLFTGGRSLPIAMGPGTNVMAFYGMKFTASGAYLSAYASFDVPAGDQQKLVAFQATGVGFQPGGLQGEARMKLMSNVSTVLGDKVKMTLKSGSGTFVAFDCYGINQVSIAGQIELCRDVATPLDPYTYEPQNDEYVTGSFTFAGSDFDELTGDVSISPFEHPKLPGWAFNVENVVFDMSDKTTPISVEFPMNYEHPDMDPDYMNGKYSPAWTGVYIGLVRVRIPDKLTGRDSSNSVTIQGAGIIIDDTGFTGNFAAINPLSLEEGKIGSWAFAIDSVDIGIQQNQFHHVSLAGLIDVPALGQPLGYGCHIQPGGYYNFSVRLTDTVSFDAMAAKLELYKNTEIGITYREVDRNFSAYAKLYGSATFGPQLGGGADSQATTDAEKKKNKLTIPSIAFENFHLTTRKPYIESIGTWALSTQNGEQPGMKKFPVKLNSVGMVQNIFDGADSREVAFAIDLTLNLVKGEDKGFGARGAVFIVCDVTTDEEAGTQEWKFKKVKIKRLGINYEGAGFKFNGFIEEFSNKPLYGNGFVGGLQASFKPSISVGVSALFGTTQDDNGDDYRYFFADAMVAFNPGINLGPSGLAIYGFGGGISYHMERVGFANLKPPVSPATEAKKEKDEEDEEPLLPADFFDDDFDPEAEYATADEDIPMPPDVKLPSEIGNSLSGVRYVPNREVGIGIKASVAFGSIKREVFNGDITFEIVFNDGGGMRYLGLTGNANFLTPPGPDAKPSVSALLDMGYDFNNDNFSAYLRLSIWAAKGVIRGAYPNGVAGEGNIYASDEEWWIYLGTPDKPFKISFDLSALANVGSKEDREKEPDPPPPPSAFSDEDLALIGGGGAASGVTEAGGGFVDPATKNRPPLGSVGDIGVLFRAYLDAGTVLPAFPPPPDRVVAILNGEEGTDTYEIIDRDNPVFADAGGLLFGAGFDISMPDLKFLIFYAEFYAGLGFDMMISNLGQTARCANNLDSDEPIGLNGWYATGQLYAYLEGAVGIDIKLGSFQAKTEILRIAAAVLLQGQMVNPVWMRGKMAGEYSVMNGLLSGRCEFEFEAGEKCEVIDVGEQNIQVMQTITPDTFSTDISVFVNPQVTFNLPEDRAMVFQEEDENKDYLIKAKLTSLRLTNDATGVRIPGQTIWNDDRTLATFQPDDILAGNTPHTITAEAQLLQKTDGDWAPVNGFGDTEADQTLAHTFTTGPAPEVIVESNVTYAYPINKQVNFLIDESGQGYVQLKKGQDYLFADLDRSKWNQVARVIQQGQVKGESAIAYNPTDNRVTFALPASVSMEREMITYLQLVNKPVNPPVAVDANLDSIRRDLADNLMPADASFADNATSIELREYVTTGVLEQPDEKEIYRLTFRTSRHASFAEKVNDLQAIRPILISHPLTEPVPVYDGNGNQVGTGPFLAINEFGRNYDSPEPLDQYDLAGDRFLEKDIAPMIRGTARLAVTANNWYRDRVAPMLYNRFPQGNFAIDWREPTALGYPPARAINFGQKTNFPELETLSEEQMLSGNYVSPPAQSINAGYHLPYNMYRDYADLWNQVGSYLATFPGEPDPFLPEFQEWQLPRPDYGNYEVRLQYFLPGAEQPSSEVSILLPHVSASSSRK